MTDLTREQIEALLDGTTPRFLIRKHGGYYKPNCQGYTSSAILAGRYTEEDAVNNTHPNGPDGPRDGMTYVSEDAVTDEDFAAYAIMRQQRDDLARQLLATMIERDEAQAAQAATVERAAEMAAEIHSSLAAAIRSLADPTGVKLLDELRAERDRMNQWRETAIVERDTYSQERDEALAKLAEAQKREAGYQEALIWCSGSDDFQADGKARAGWLKLCAPLIDRAALSAAPTGEESRG